MAKKLFLALISVIIFSLSSVNFAQDKTSSSIPPIPKRISGGVLNSKALSLLKTVYPAAARAANIKGSVNISLIISKRGNVMSARAINGHPLLRNAAVSVARRSRFAPTIISDKAVEVAGVVVVTFYDVSKWFGLGKQFGQAEFLGLPCQYRILGDGFEFEEKQINLIRDESVENQMLKLPSIIELIKAKLNTTDLWRFEFGYIKAKTLNNWSNKTDKEIIESLKGFKYLSDDIPAEVEEHFAKGVKKIIAFSKKDTFTKEEREMLYSFLERKLS